MAYGLLYYVMEVPGISKIEGEISDRESVQSSIWKQRMDAIVISFARLP
ncbi:hypothetical protein [Spirosoma sp.]